VFGILENYDMTSHSIEVKNWSFMKSAVGEEVAVIR
jgi:hypothetical protein